MPVTAQELSQLDADDEITPAGTGVIVVTAQKREQAITDVPISITSFSEEDIESLRITSFDDYAVRTPNISFNNSSGNRSDVRFSIRGVGPISRGGSGNSVGVYLDEFNIAPNILARTVDTQLQDAARIEILRGPQGTFFGRNTVGGAISITTVKPDPGEFSGHVKAGYSSYDTYLGEAALNVPLGPDMAVRVLGYYDRTDGFLEQRGTHDEGNATENYGGRAALRWQPGATTTIYLSAIYSNQQQELPNFVPTGFLSEGVELLTTLVGGAAGRSLSISDLAAIVGAADPLPDGAFPQNEKFINTDIGFPSENETLTIIGRVEQELTDDIALTVVGGYIDNTYSAFGEGDYTVNPSFTVGQDVDFEAYSIEGRLSGGADRFNWLVGGFYGHDQVDQLQTTENLATDPFTVNPIPGIGLGAYPLAFFCLGGISRITGCPTSPVPGFRRFIPGVNTSTGFFENVRFGSEVDSYAVFGDATYELTDRLSISLGARYTNEEVSSFRVEGALADPFAPRLSNPGTTANFDDFSPRVAAVYEISDAVNLYGNVSRGFRSGGSNPVPDNPTTPGIDESVFEKESIWNYEIGAKLSALNGRVRGSLSFFYMDWTDIQIRAQDVFTQRQTIQNAPGATNKGLEFEVAVTPFTGLDLGFNYGYIDATFGDFPNARTLDGAVIDATGNELPNSPDNTFSALARYSIPVGDDFDLYVQGEYAFVDDTQVDIARDDRRANPQYDLINLRAGFETGVIRFQAFIENVTNESYRLGSNNLETYLSGTQAVVGERRSYGVQGTFRF